MPKYSDPLDPHYAARQFRGRPGNYILHFEDGSAYAGRQGERGVRLNSHMRNHGDQVVAVQFMHDHSNDPCVRADREKQTVDRLEDEGRSLRNVATPSLPQSCPPRKRR
jgi:hypothetical protein